MIFPIANGTDYQNKIKKISIRDHYNISNEKLILISSGSLIERKNHSQTIQSMSLLPKSVQENIIVIICGKGKDTETISQLVKDFQLEKNIIIAGPVEPEEMPSYYAEANGYIMPSKAEGLSISVLEAMTFGLPTILFGDSECIEEINDQRLVSIADQRTDVAFANAIIKWYENIWDKDYIKEYSKKFTMKRMADDYLDYYNKLLQGEL